MAASWKTGLDYRWWTMDQYRDLLAAVMTVLSLSAVGLLLFVCWFLM